MVAVALLHNNNNNNIDFQDPNHHSTKVAFEGNQQEQQGQGSGGSSTSKSTSCCKSNNDNEVDLGVDLVDEEEDVRRSRSPLSTDQYQYQYQDQEDNDSHSDIDFEFDPSCDPILQPSSTSSSRSNLSVSPRSGSRPSFRPRTRTVTFTSGHSHHHHHYHHHHSSSSSRNNSNNRNNRNYGGNYNSDWNPNSNNFVNNLQKPISPNHLNSNSSSNSTNFGSSPTYKEVVVVGNGPSGIVLSYFLAGNWPYYNGQGESVHEMLHYRLLAAQQQNRNNTKNNNQQSRTLKKHQQSESTSSLVEQDLNFLSQGLEGRSSNPVALLFDSLNHPQADLGLELPTLLDWELRGAEERIDHVVIGRGPPGGAWQSMDGNVLTISLGCWMELPEMNFREWEAEQETRCCRESRASVASVAQYYCDYVRKHQLDKYFLTDSVITHVQRIHPNSNNREDVKAHDRCFESSSQQQQQDYVGLRGKMQHNSRQLLHPDSDCLPFVCDNNYFRSEFDASVEMDMGESEGRIPRRHTISEIPTSNLSSPKFSKRWNRPLWKVKGYTRVPQKATGQENSTESSSTLLQPFSYVTPNLVLATGASDKPNVLNVPGEDLPFVLHSLNDLEHLIEAGVLNRDSDPVVVVGAGLCAADAIIAARFHSIPVVHVFRRSVRDPDLIFRQLPQNMYPEYHKIYQMMQDPVGYDNYTACPEHVVTQIRPDGKVNLSGPISCGTLKVSYVAICIGNQPDLSFLGEEIESTLGVYPGLPVDCKRNPVSIDFFSHQSTRHPGLYALGPVVGENFVRFLQGGALAVTNHLVRQKEKEEGEKEKQQQQLESTIPIPTQPHSASKWSNVRHYVQSLSSADRISVE